MLMQRSAFADALTWLEIHGAEPDKLEFWREHGAAPGPEGDTGEAPPRRRRRRRGRRRPGFPSPKAPE
jgi:hypothetical protein